MCAREKVEACLRRAFACVQRPTHTLADAWVADEWGDETARFAESDRHWWEIPDELIERVTAAFHFLPLESYSYYLPAYLTWMCQSYSKKESGATDHVEWILTSIETREKIAAILDSPQKDAVARFVGYMAAAVDAADPYDGFGKTSSALGEAFAAFWKKYIRRDCVG